MLKSLLLPVIIYALFICPVCPVQPGPGITVLYDHPTKTVKIKWMHLDEQIVHYSVQRSTDESTWLVLQEIKAAALNTLTTFRDKAINTGKLYYRVKAIGRDGLVTYSEAVPVVIGLPGGTWTIYPVPVREILNLRYDGVEAIKGILFVSIQNISTGQYFQKLRMASTSRLIAIPVSNLGRGAYLLTVSANGQTIWKQKFTK